MTEASNESALTRFRESEYTLNALRRLRGGTFMRILALEESGDHSRDSLVPHWDFVSNAVGELLLELGEKEREDGALMQVTMGNFLSIAVRKSQDSFWSIQPHEDPSGLQIETDHQQTLDFEDHNRAIACVTALMVAEHFKPIFPYEPQVL